MEDTIPRAVVFIKHVNTYKPMSAACFEQELHN